MGRVRSRLAGCLAALSLLVGAGASGEPSACAPWPGEPAPLPDVASAEPVSARWASLRAAELARLALKLERARPLDAFQLWRHAGCLDPESAAVRAGLARTAPVRLHRPSVIATPSAPGPSGGEGGAPRDLALALRMLDAPLVVSARAPVVPVRAQSVAPPDVALGPPPLPSPTERLRRATARIDARLDEARALLHGARFDELLEYAADARARMLPLTWDRGIRERLAELEVIVASAEIALGRERAARETFARALAAHPELTLDPETTSPKVLRAFHTARIAAEAP